MLWVEGGPPTHLHTLAALTMPTSTASITDSVVAGGWIGIQAYSLVPTALTRMAITETSGALREIGRGHALLKQLPNLSGAA